jgi:NitT/TauT family transport system substrate-binding protein
LRDEFFARSALDPDIVRGLDQLMAEAVNFKYLPAPLTPAQLAELVQVPLK